MSAEAARPHSTYSFGDSDLAARRLQLLAEVFAPSTREFLTQLVGQRPRNVLDLGCGPGCTTHLLAEIFPDARIRGLDNSSSFIEIAQRTRTERVSFITGDATRLLSGEKYDLIYCRYLLTHVVDVGAAVACWSRQLSLAGNLAIEENDWIHTERRAFAKYVEIVEAMLADQGQQLYIGAKLDSLRGSLDIHSSECVPVVVNDRDTARMFSMNLESWRNRPFILERYASSEIERLHRELESLARGDVLNTFTQFGRRRLVLAKSAPPERPA